MSREDRTAAIGDARKRGDQTGGENAAEGNVGAPRAQFGANDTAGIQAACLPSAGCPCICHRPGITVSHVTACCDGSDVAPLRWVDLFGIDPNYLEGVESDNDNLIEQGRAEMRAKVAVELCTCGDMWCQNCILSDKIRAAIGGDQ